MNILVASSNRDLLSSLERALLHNGHQVKSVFDGVQILSELQFNEFDCLLLDKNIQRLLYDEVIRKIRVIGIKIPVLLILDSSIMSLSFLSQPALADEYLLSPFHVSKLLQTIDLVTSQQNEDKIEKTIGNVTYSNKFYFLQNGDSLVHISVKEFLIFNLLSQSFNKVVDNEKLSQKIQQNHLDLNLLWVYISALNEKLKMINGNVRILNSREGYKMVLKK